MSLRRLCHGLVLLAAFAVIVGSVAAQPPAREAAIEHFEKHVRPLLIAKCYGCHSAEKGKSKGGLTLDTQEGWKQGGESGPAVVPGKPDDSLLIQAVRYHDTLRMPPKSEGGRLKDAEIAVLEKWVRDGAVDPRTKDAAHATTAAGREWWAFRPIASPVPPAGSPTHPIDAFVAVKWQPSLTPLPRADKRALLRRATFDLTGLPPTPEEVQAFLVDTSPDAFRKVIDRLLASAHYGEKWGRHWLDVVRYADSLDERGYDKDGDILDAWRYRDWVLEAFNRDLPYDQFIVHQLAGDIVASRKWDPKQVIATGMYAIGNWGNGDADKEKLHTDIVDDQVDVTSRAFLGVTLACARCHDHKFDPFTTRDYYGLAGFFFSSHILDKFQSKGEGEKLMRIPLLSPEEKAKQQAALKRIGEIDAVLGRTLRPLTEVKQNIAGRSGLHAWTLPGSDNPSLVINTTDKPVAFSTIKMGARAVAMHPGPRTPASAVWKSPAAGKAQVSLKLRDADPNCGDGIEWEVRSGTLSLRKGTMDNGGSATVPDLTTEMQAGELLQVTIRPRKEYTCDTTELEVTVSLGERRWDLRDSLVRGDKQGESGWWLCSGEGDRLANESADLAKLEAERSELTKASMARTFAQGLLEGGIPGTPYAGFHDAKVHVRGSYARLGDVVPRSLPAVLCAEQPKLIQGSGRMELARWIASPANPLTARVMVNRLWQHHFGEGLVRTPNNFGKLGTPPTHPELLDYLATEFVRSGWSMKAMHRLILTSETYQRSSLFSDANSIKGDPDNQWLARQHRRRLSAEELRDAMLAVTAELDRTLGGKAIRELNTKRRTLYVTTIRSDRSNYQALFDAADPTAIVEKRTEATVAPQALWLLNHPFVLDRAKVLAGQVMKHSGDRDGKVRWLYERLFSRVATEEELTLARRIVTDAAKADGWIALCQVLLCSNEFLYVD
jgi:hypothetical protein